YALEHLYPPGPAAFADRQSGTGVAGCGRPSGSPPLPVFRFAGRWQQRILDQSCRPQPARAALPDQPEPLMVHASPSRPRGRFLTLEGVDGAGKSTHVEWLCEALRKLGKTVVSTREP